MKKYEGLFIFPVQGASAEDLIKEVSEWIQKLEGKVSETTDLGTRRLGYEIKKHRDGKFCLVFFELDPAKVSSLKKDLELKENLLKYMITVAKPKNPNKKYAQPLPEETPEEVTA